MDETTVLAGLPLRPGEHPPRPDAVKVSVLDDGGPRHHSARTKARKAALDVLYQAELRRVDPLDALADVASATRPFTREIVQGVRYHQDTIDQCIAAAVTGDWSLERMPGLDRALARMATWEIHYGGVAAGTAIAEALGLADEFSTDSSVAFLNGLLGAVAGGPPSDIAPAGAVPA